MFSSFLSSSDLSFHSLNNPFFIRYSTIISKWEYKVPHRTTISKKIIDEIYEEVLKEIVSFANSSSHLAITCDGWTDKNATHWRRCRK